MHNKQIGNNEWSGAISSVLVSRDNFEIRFAPFAEIPEKFTLTLHGHTIGYYKNFEDAVKSADVLQEIEDAKFHTALSG